MVKSITDKFNYSKKIGNVFVNEMYLKCVGNVFEMYLLKLQILEHGNSIYFTREIWHFSPVMDPLCTISIS